MKKIYQSIFACVPKGQNENSPAFQRRDRRAKLSSPEGTNDVVRRDPFQPSLRDLAHSCIQPGVETPGYFRLFLRNRGLTFFAAALLSVAFLFSAVAQGDVN